MLLVLKRRFCGGVVEREAECGADSAPSAAPTPNNEERDPTEVVGVEICASFAFSDTLFLSVKISTGSAAAAAVIEAEHDSNSMAKRSIPLWLKSCIETARLLPLSEAIAIDNLSMEENLASFKSRDLEPK